MNYSKPCIEKNQVQFIVHLVVEDQIYDSVSDAQATFANAAARFPGHVKSFVHQVDCDKIGSIALIAVHSFDTADNLVRWLQSDVRRRLMKNFDTSFQDQFEVQYPGEIEGFTSWLSRPNSEDINRRPPPPKWKINFIVLAILYPITLILVPVLHSWLPNASRATIQFFTALIAVSALGFWLVPWASKVLAKWLHAKDGRSHITGTIILCGLLYIAWQIANGINP
jgi:antibiotic biosynthesis monooxygenase (ABM) superfamily enzyme